jgi:hypothetical protein
MDDVDLWELIEPLLWQAPGNDEHWSEHGKFADPEIMDQAYAVMRRKRTDVQQQIAVRGADVDAGREKPDVYHEWRRRALRLMRTLDWRLSQIKPLLDREKQSRHQSRMAVERDTSRVVLAKLTAAVAQHQADIPESTAADRRLWQWLDTLKVSAAGEELSLREMLDEGMWTDRS